MSTIRHLLHSVQDTRMVSTASPLVRTIATPGPLLLRASPLALIFARPLPMSN